MIRLNFHEYAIELINETTFKFGSADNVFDYANHYFGEDGKEYPTSKHGIKLFNGEEVVGSCIVIGSGGGTSIHETSNLIDGQTLLVCCCNTIFCLTLPKLDLKWKTKTDISTCFQIFKQDHSYLVHGEFQVSKLNQIGNIEWLFGGSDIFVSIDNQDEFKVESDGILLVDFANTQYKIDFDGNLLWHKQLANKNTR